MAFGSEVAYIIGPPGTGKTVTLTAIALEHLKSGRTVLIASHVIMATISNTLMIDMEAGKDDKITPHQRTRKQ
jgi:DNA replication protein DnaC